MQSQNLQMQAWVFFLCTKFRLCAEEINYLLYHPKIANSVSIIDWINNSKYLFTLTVEKECRSFQLYVLNLTIAYKKIITLVRCRRKVNGTHKRMIIYKQNINIFQSLYD